MLSRPDLELHCIHSSPWHHVTSLLDLWCPPAYTSLRFCHHHIPHLILRGSAQKQTVKDLPALPISPPTQTCWLHFFSDSSVPTSLSLVFLIFGTSLQSQCRVSLSEVRKGAQRGYKNVWVALLPCGPARIGTQACVTPEPKPSFHSTQLRHSQGKYSEPKTVRTLKIIFVFNAGSLRCHDLPKVTQFLPTCFSHLSQKPSVNCSGP